MTATETGVDAASGDASPLVVATYNIRYSGLDEGRLAWERRRDAVAATVREASPDVIAIQECWLDQLDDLAARLPAYEWVGYPDRTGEHTPLGYDPDRVVVASSGAFGLAPGGERGVPGWDAGLARTVTHATFRDTATGERFAVFSVHFDSQGSRARTESAGLVARRLPDCPAVVAGDLNCRPGTEPYRVLTDELDDTYEVADERAGPGETYVGFGGAGAGENGPPDRKRVDYVLARGFEVARHATLTPTTDGAPPSDHLPVVAELALPGDD